MKFIKRPYSPALIAAGLFRRTQWRLTLCALLAAAVVGPAHFNLRPAQSASAKTLSGEAAIQSLKADGGYTSLAAAVTAARYQINATPAPFNHSAPSARRDASYYADNPGQRLRATFGPGEARFAAAPNGGNEKARGDAEGKAAGEANRAELTLRLTGFGYGDKVEPLAGGVLSARGDRIEIKKSAAGEGPEGRSAITEWYVNKPEGVEQGFTLASRPSGGGHGEWLRVDLALGEGWRAIVREGRQGALLERTADGLRLGYDQLQALDAHGRALPSRMEFEGGTLALLVDDARAAYPLTIDPILTRQQKLVATNPPAEGGQVTVFPQFGKAIAISGDTAVIGAPGETIGSRSAQGAAYIFVRGVGGWVQQQKLTANDAAAEDFFGFSVAISGDTVLVSAPNDDIGANKDQGSVYVFTRGAGAQPVWTQQQKLTANDGAASDFFGQSVAISGDTLVVGSVNDDVGANADQGSAYVFARSGGVWSQQQKLTANDGAAGDFFGQSVAISGDTVVVGAPDDDTGKNENQGSAYVFARSGASGGAVWAQQQKLTAVDGAGFDFYGLSVAVSGNTVAVSAFAKNIDVNPSQGAVYIYTRGSAGGGATPPAWTQQQRLTAADGRQEDFFGGSVALSGDTAVIGSGGHDVGLNSAQGSAYVFSRNGSVWTQQQELFADDGAAEDELGDAVALSGDTVIVGSPNNTRGGAAYVFVILDNKLAQRQPLTASDGAAKDGFGSAIAIGGDTVVIGARVDDVGANADQGSAYVFVRGGTAAQPVWTQQQRLIANDGAAGAFFGGSVAISGDTVVVGAVGDAVGGKRLRGSAYVFTRSGGVWTQQQKLTVSDGEDTDFFGGSVAVSGNSLAVGAPGVQIGANRAQGAVYVFTRSGGVWSQQKKLTSSDSGTVFEFGTSVALSGDTLVAGAPNSPNGSLSKYGAVYVFARSGGPQPVWTQLQRIAPNDGSPYQGFGFSVALSGDSLIVGVLDDNTFTEGSQGSAYVFTRGQTGAASPWTQQQKLIANDGAFHNYFSTTVAISGDTAVVGSFFDTVDGKVDQGSVYVFTRGGAAQPVWSRLQRLLISDGAAEDNFGIAVALGGDTLVVGADGDDVGSNVNQGSAYVFAAPACPTITLDPAGLPGARVGTSYSQTVTSVGGAGPYQYSLSGGALPPGLSLSQNGQISGAPTAAGIYQFTITSTILSSLCPGSRSYTLIVSAANCPAVTVSPSTLPSGRSGAAYSQQLTGAGGAAPYGFALNDGALPNGISLSATGLLSGAPTVFGSFNFTVRAADAGGCQGTRAYTLTIAAPCATITVSPNSLPDGTVGAAYSQTVTASGGVAPYTYAVSAGALPAGLSLGANGAISGSPTGAGVFNFTIRATDAGGCQGTRAYTVTAKSSACAFTVTPINQAFPPEGGSGQVSVTGAQGCEWTAVADDPLIMINSGASGGGNGVVKFEVLKNTSPGARRGTLTVAGRKVTVAQAPPVACASAASFAGGALAGEGIVAAFGSGLANATEVAATLPLPLTLAETRVSVLDSAGAERFAPLFFVSPGQVNFQIPPGTAGGAALVTILRGEETVGALSPQIVTVAPGFFSADASGLGVMNGLVVRVKNDGSQSFEPITRFDGAANKFVATPIDLGPDQGAASDKVFLVAFATGLRNRSGLEAVNVKIGGVSVDALYAGPQGTFTGLDQINVLLPRGLAGKGEVELSVTVDGKPANALKMAIR